jgi:aspartate kinase
MSAPLVIKFGGTSLGTAARVRRAARRVAAHVRRGRRVAVVVSARGGVTDRIVRLLSRVSAGRPHPREVDRALATGEDLSAALLASALASLGVPARSLRGGEAGVRAEGGFAGGRVERVDPGPLRALLAAGTVPVVSGFQGARADGETVTLGRGASDLSAVEIAAALGAECHIVTDVRGVFDRDPRGEAAARFFTRLSHAELVRAAEDGARVVQPEAARQALRRGIPLRIYHFRAELSGESGTRIDAAPGHGAVRAIEMPALAPRIDRAAKPASTAPGAADSTPRYRGLAAPLPRGLGEGPGVGAAVASAPGEPVSEVAA